MLRDIKGGSTSLSYDQSLWRKVRLQYLCSEIAELNKRLGQTLNNSEYVLTLAERESIVASLASAALTTDDIRPANTLSSQGAAGRARGTPTVAITWQSSVVVESHQ